MSGLLAVYSGKCLKAVCGEETGFKDMRGKSLRTGDVVIIFSVRGSDDCLDYFPDGLTAVVSDRWTSYSDGTIVEKEGDVLHFVMGIKSVPLDDTDTWRVMKVKGFEDVLLGERWTDYGFNYMEAPEASYHAGGE